MQQNIYKLYKLKNKKMPSQKISGMAKSNQTGYACGCPCGGTCDGCTGCCALLKTAFTFLPTL